MIRVQVRPNEPLEAALRRFKRQCNYAGIFRLAKKYAYHEKRSDKRRREERERIRSIMIAERKRGGSRGGRSSKRRRLRSSSIKPRKSGEDFDPLTADTTVQRPEGEVAKAQPAHGAGGSTRTPGSTTTPVGSAASSSTASSGE